jgi:hypothetical protein
VLQTVLGFKQKCSFVRIVDAGFRKNPHLSEAVQVVAEITKEQLYLLTWTSEWIKPANGVFTRWWRIADARLVIAMLQKHATWCISHNGHQRVRTGGQTSGLASSG